MVAMNNQEQAALNNAVEQAEEYTVYFLDNDVAVYVESDDILITL